MGRVRVQGRARRYVVAMLVIVLASAGGMRPAEAAGQRPPVPRLPVIKVAGIVIAESLGVLIGWGFIARLRP